MIFYILTAVLVVLKLLEYITVSWWIVLAPALITAILGIVFVVGGMLFMAKIHRG